MTEQHPHSDHGCLIVRGADRPGIVAGVSGVLTAQGAGTTTPPSCSGSERELLNMLPEVQT